METLDVLLALMGMSTALGALIGAAGGYYAACKRHERG